MRTTTLFGRSEALSAADRALADAAAGRGGVVVVTGEAGIGKTAVVATVASRAAASGARVAHGRAWEIGGAPPYWPWSQALRELGLDLDAVLGTSSGERAEAQRLVAFDRVLRAVCERDDQPVVVVLDDLHAADIASVELALAFARGVRRKRALLVVATRETDLHERREVADLVAKLGREGVVLPLQRLDASDTASWLASVGFDGDAGAIHRLTEGNPLFIEEALRLGVDRFATAATGGVAVILGEHLARLASATRDVLAVASIFGREASHAELAAICDATTDDVQTAIREGHRAGVLTAMPDALAFSHVLWRDALYAGLPASRRAMLHARAASLGGPPARVAMHQLAAGDAIDAPIVVRTVCRAAEAAIEHQAADSAIELLGRARARLSGRLDESGTLALDLAVVEAIMQAAPSDTARARAAGCAARAKRLGLVAEHARAALAYAREVHSAGVDPVMVALLEAALAQVPPDQRPLRARLLSRLAAALIPPTSEAQMLRSADYAHEALALARATGDAATRLHALTWSLSALTHLLPLSERLDLTTEIVSLARSRHADLALVDIGGVHAVSLRESGRVTAARHEADVYVAQVASLPLPALAWRASALRATMAALDGEADATREHLDDLRRSASTQHAGVAWAFFEVAHCACTRDVDRLGAIEHELIPILASRDHLEPWRACVDALLGRHDDARARLKPIVHVSRAARGLLVQAQVVALLGSAELADRFYEPLLRAAPYGRFFWGPASTFPFGPTSRLLGELALLRGDRARAREHLDAAVAECRELEALPFVALAEEARARTGGSPRAVPAIAMSVSLVREGDAWLVTASAHAPFRVKHAKGMDYLDQLLRNPGCELHALALAGADEGNEDAGVILDERAKRAYKQRIDDLEDRLADAERRNDRGRAERARAELDALAEQLAAAVGLGGRDRKAASNVERARINVQRRVKDAIRRIGEHDATLGRYLHATVRTGTYCMFTPV